MSEGIKSRLLNRVKREFNRRNTVGQIEVLSCFVDGWMDSIQQPVSEVRLTLLQGMKHSFKYCQYNLVSTKTLCNFEYYSKLGILCGKNLL